MGKRKRHSLADLVLFGFGVLLLMPVVYMLAASLFSEMDMLRYYRADGRGMYFHLIPQHLSLTQFSAACTEETDFLPGMGYSVLYALAISGVRTGLAVSAGYALAFFRFPLRRFFMGLMLILMLIPPLVMQVPVYIQLRSMGILDTAGGFVFAYALQPMSVLLLTYSFSHIPEDTMEAAELDGCGAVGRLIRIVLPQAEFAVRSVFLLSFVDVWNMIEGPRIFLADPMEFPLAVLLPEMMSRFFTDAPLLGSLFLLFPVLLYAACQESLETYMIEEAAHYAQDRT